jgi:DNA-binding NarL/FixJ family response regulator
LAFLDFDAERMRAVIAASYTFSGDLPSWARGVQEALAPAVDLGQGTLASVVLLSDRGLRIQHLRRAGGASRVHEAVVWLSALLAREKLREAFFNGRVIGSSSEHYDERDLDAMTERAGRARSRDAVGFCVNDGVDHGFMLVAPARTRVSLPREPRAVIKRMGQHVATGLRLQRVISSAALEDPAVEAIFDAAGRPQHLLGMLRAGRSLERLRELVAERIGARGAELAEGPAWDAVVAGRWSLVDRFDADRRRFIVAYRNPPGVVDPRRLTAREEGVATLASLGRSNKEIAMDLGTSDSTVANSLAAALGKLGLDSRTLLPIFWRDLHGRAWAVDRADARLIALGGRADPEGLAALSPAERAVAKGMLAGLSDRDIASARRCSRNTIANHTAAVYRKLGVHSRAELASKLSRASEQEASQ